jgi:hypothetical protein
MEGLGVGMRELGLGALDTSVTPHWSESELNSLLVASPTRSLLDVSESTGCRLASLSPLDVGLRLRVH